VAGVLLRPPRPASFSACPVGGGVVNASVLISGHEDGIYVLVPAVIAVLVGGVVNAWLILVRLPDS
jgi:hypothetical protein